MAKVKLGDRVTVEFEGVVDYQDGEDIEVDGYMVPPGATVTVLPAKEPTGVGAVARVTYPAHSNWGSYTPVRLSSGVWFSSENDEECWEDLFDESGTVEILSQGVDLAP